MEFLTRPRIKHEYFIRRCFRLENDGVTAPAGVFMSGGADQVIENLHDLSSLLFQPFFQKKAFANMDHRSPLSRACLRLCSRSNDCPLGTKRLQTSAWLFKFCLFARSTFFQADN